MSAELPGIEFEKIVAKIQEQLDPAAKVTHNEKITNKLGHSRQFDVVIRGTFAGQSMLGIIECKDLKKKVGSQEVDAFVTKAQDVNANFKILMSRNGFSKPALAQCAHNGIQALSLLNGEPVNNKFFIGVRWEVDIISWGQVVVTLHFEKGSDPQLNFNANDIKIKGKRVLDWFTNYLLEREETPCKEFGWVINTSIEFDEVQSVEVSPNEAYLCTAMSFQAERICDKRERLVGISGTGFFNWNSKQATIPAGATIKTEAVPMNFNEWKVRSSDMKPPTGFLDVYLQAYTHQLERSIDVLDLNSLGTLTSAKN